MKELKTRRKEVEKGRSKEKKKIVMVSKGN